MDRLSKEQRHRNMSHIKNKDTKIEIILRRALWHAGIRYRKNYDKLPGKPDIAITKHNIAIFCDGEFFHGKDWGVLRTQLASGSNAQFWIGKIARNIDRDDAVNKQLESMGWTVLRFWGKVILKHTGECVETVKEAIFRDEMDKEDF